MFDKLKKIFSNKDIVIKLAFTLLILFVFKMGTYITIPLANVASINNLVAENSFLNLLNTFSGGGLSQFSILALGISPYITASIVTQMMQMIIPKLKEWQEQGETGKTKLNRITRYLAVILAFIQALVLLFGLGSRPENILVSSALIYKDYYWLFYLYMALVITAGSAFTLWLADLITKKGIGNGSSMIIVAGIVSSIPAMFTTLWTKYFTTVTTSGVISFISIILLYVIMILFVVYFEASKRKIKVQYANRQGSQNSDIPLKLNSAGVIPVIFASTLLSIPLTIIGMTGLTVDSSTPAFWMDQVFNYQQPIGIALYIILIFFFSFFYSFLQMDPDKLSDNLSKSGAYIPGYKPGEETKIQISKVLFRITMIGAAYLVFLALVPIVVSKSFGFTTQESSVIVIGGTSLLIIVGVAIETARQIETDAEAKSYRGLI